MTAAIVTEAVDCDLHVAPAGFDDLRPYLDEYWHSYIDDATVRLAQPAYPAGARTTGPPPAARYEQLAPLLDTQRPRQTIVNCLTLDGIHRNPHYSAAIASAVNDWVRDEFLARDERLRAGLVVSPLDIPAAVAELSRLAGDERFAHVLLPVRSDLPYGNRIYHPLYEAAQEHGLPIALHAWGREARGTSLTGITRTYLEDYASNAHIAQMQMMSLVAEGTFTNLTDLRVVFLECGFSWLAPQLWRFDKDWKGVWREVPWIEGRPSDYVRRHMRFTTAPSQLPHDIDQAVQVVAMVGAELLLYASDHPHDHGDGVERLLGALSEVDAEAILRRNAAEFYARSVS